MAQALMEDAAREYMAERRKRKVTVTEREYAWVLNEDTGEVTLHVGPCQISPTTGEYIVEDDGEGGYERVDDRTRNMIEVADGQYAVLFNPLDKDSSPEHPNGEFKRGRNEPKPLANGTKQMIPGPCAFYLRPGQRAEVCNAHELGSNQYLMVKVYGELDKTAPYYDITRQSAKVVSFTVADINSAVVEDGKTDEAEADTIHRGQWIVIRGIDTQFYIPPTGVEVVPDTSCDASGSAISGDRARAILEKALNTPEARKAAFDHVATGGGTEVWQQLAAIDSSASTYDSAPKAQNYSAGNVRGFAPGIEQAAVRRQRVAKDANSYKALLSNLRQNPTLRAEFAKAASQVRLVREAVVLTEKEFCVIVDADGRRNVTKGPARVFPGPNDTFMIEGSRNRVYDAYELLPTRALWLRVITPITKQALVDNLPPGSESLLTKDTYNPGDEILLQGVNAFFFPFNEIEVLSPVTGQAEVGNDHAMVFIEAIGIDQKSGIYVRDLRTGEAKLIRGLRSYLVNPAEEVHIERRVSAVDWNHWVFAHRPHKHVTEDQTTPWALSIRVPNNTAIMATSAAGQRVITGPCVELLEYEEKLAYLNLSTGTPKTDDKLLRTCFLQVRGNRVSDKIRVQTSDFVDIDIQVSYRNQFEEEHQDRWFNQENFVQAMVDHLRSLVRNAIRRKTLGEAWPVIPDLVRETILGKKDPETGARTGRFFEENGMLVTEVEVLNATILDDNLSTQFSAVQRNLVSLQIGDREAKARLESDRVRSEVEEQSRAIKEKNARLRSELDAINLALNTEHKLARIKADEAGDKLLQEAQLLRKRQEAEVTNALRLAAAEAEATAQQVKDTAIIKTELDRADIQKILIDARAAADVARNESVQEGLIEALQSLGNKLVMTEAAQNMNLVSLIKGESFGDIFQHLFEGTTVAKSLGALGTLAAVKGVRGLVDTDDEYEVDED